MKLYCQWCGQEFVSDRSNKKYCSKKCYVEYQKGKPCCVGAVRKYRPKLRRKSTCVVCGIEFEHANYRDRKYCGKKCWEVRNPKVMINCLYCGKEFWKHKSQKRKKYCSKRCCSLHLRELKSGCNSPLWRGGKTELSKLERSRTKYDEWRNAVFLRDDYTCQKCKIKSTRGLKVYLQAHHIERFADSIEKRFDVSNGITLCKNCHLLEHHHKF